MRKLSITNRLVIAAFVLTAVIAGIVLPLPDKVNLKYELNRPWSNPTLLAPFQIPVYRDAETKKRLTDSIEAQFEPIFTIDETPLQRIETAINSAGSLNTTQRRSALTALRQIYDNGVISDTIYRRINDGSIDEIKIHTLDINKTISARKLKSPKMAYLALDSLLAPDLMAALRNIDITTYLTPNYVENHEESDRLRSEMLQPIQAATGVIQKGERIIDRGERVTPQLYQILQTYESEMAKRSGKINDLYITAGQILFTLTAFASLFFFLYFYRRETLRDLWRVVCLLSLLLVFFIFGVVMSDNFGSGIYIVPFAILPIVVVVFYDTSIALFTMLLELVLCAAFAPLPFEFVFLELMAGLTALYSTKELSRRSQLVKTSALVFAAYVVSYLAVEVMQGASIGSFTWRLIGYFAINMALTSFAYFLIFLVEKLFGFTSVVTLVELADINNEVLRKLSIECPGTFQHCMALSNLVSSAAHRIGANVQLVRAGALYHDIGKIKNPAFFTENQHGVNPHDALDPMQSAQIIINHVTEGAKMADKEKLPRVIRDMVLQHHGRSTARYFYNTYCNAHPDEEVDPTPFTYPGPNPQTKEASLLMMGDAVEAASRSLKDHSLESITNLVDKLIDKQIEEGLHKDSPLSFRDITEIKRAFVDSLRTTFHTRIAYPDLKK